MNGLPYYKAYPRDFFEGTIGMDFEVKSAYRLLLDLIYMHGGKLADDPRFIAGHLGCSVRKWIGLRHAILQTGKITLSGSYLGNYRADKELDALKSLRDKQRENASKTRKNNALGEAMAKPKPSHTEPEPEPDILPGAKAPSSSDDDTTAKIREAFDAYNEAAEAAGWPKAQALTPKRKAALRNRIKDAGGVEGWRAALEKARASPLCCGQNERGWTADLDFLLQQSSFTKLMEGSYDRRPQAGANANGRRASTAEVDRAILDAAAALPPDYFSNPKYSDF